VTDRTDAPTGKQGAVTIFHVLHIAVGLLVTVSGWMIGHRFGHRGEIVGILCGFVLGYFLARRLLIYLVVQALHGRNRWLSRQARRFLGRFVVQDDG
jgi:hypothetical protein